MKVIHPKPCLQHGAEQKKAFGEGNILHRLHHLLESSKL